MGSKRLSYRNFPPQVGDQTFRMRIVVVRSTVRVCVLHQTFQRWLGGKTKNDGVKNIPVLLTLCQNAIHHGFQIGLLRRYQFSWGWLALDTDCNVRILNFGTALIIGGIDDNDTLILMNRLAGELQRAAVPSLVVARIQGSHRDVQNDAASELNFWLTEVAVQPQLSRLALGMPLTPGEATKGELEVLDLVEKEWEVALARKRWPDERDRQVYRRMLDRKPGYLPSAAVSAVML